MLNRNQVKVMSLLVAVNVESVLVLMAVIWCGEYLNKHLPVAYLDWMAICLGFGLLVVVYSLILILKELKKPG